MISYEKPSAIVTELFIRGRKINVFLVFVSQSYFKVRNEVRLNSTHFSKQKRATTNCNKSFIRH